MYCSRGAKPSEIEQPASFSRDTTEPRGIRQNVFVAVTNWLGFGPGLMICFSQVIAVFIRIFAILDAWSGRHLV